MRHADLIEAQKWEALTAHMSKSVGKSIELVALPPSKLDDAVEKGEVDFVLVNPATAVIITEKFGAKTLATMSAKGSPKFAGVIISKKGSGLHKAADLKGKSVLAFQAGVSAGAWVFQTYHMMQKGINGSDFSSFTDSKKQDDIPLAVKAGVVDVGFIRSGLLESMQKEGKLAIDDFIIVDEKKDELPFVHSTVLYPEWFMVATKKMPDDMADKIKKTVLSLKASDEAAKSAEIDGFVEAISLDGMKAALKALKVAPYAG
jgi:twitching motility protein PilJ